MGTGDNCISFGYAIGAAAFTRTVTDPDWDDGEEPVTLATFGKMPEGCGISCRFGDRRRAP